MAPDKITPVAPANRSGKVTGSRPGNPRKPGRKTKENHTKEPAPGMGPFSLHYEMTPETAAALLEEPLMANVSAAMDENPQHLTPAHLKRALERIRDGRTLAYADKTLLTLASRVIYPPSENGVRVPAEVYENSTRHVQAVAFEQKARSLDAVTPRGPNLG